MIDFVKEQLARAAMKAEQARFEADVREQILRSYIAIYRNLRGLP